MDTSFTSAESYNATIVLILAVGFTFATILGYLTQRANLSPILGYLLAGYLIGPYSPGFVANLPLSEQLAEIGVILMMFGVGLHFKWQELVNVRNIAIPGAIIQTLVAALAGMIFAYSLGWTLGSGLVIGLSIGVASTVVMVRILSDNNLLGTSEGHIAVGWLIIEDLITVLVLLFLPAIASSFSGHPPSLPQMAIIVAWAVLKCLFLVFLMFGVGFKVVSYIFLKIARTRSQELFTLTVLAVTFGIAIGSSVLFGTSIALGAFIAGMVVGQTEVKHQVSAHALPLRDTFAVIFFLSAGMLFNPLAIAHNIWLFVGILAIILLLKPLTAFLIVRLWKYPLKSALLIAVALAQIGEFSFILSEEAMRLHILPEEGFDIIVASALVSIALNPLIFKSRHLLEKCFGTQQQPNQGIQNQNLFIPKAIVIGFGPVGQAATFTLEQLGFRPIIIENNVDTVAMLKAQKREAIFGDASLEHIQEVVHIEKATFLVITIPELVSTINSINVARKCNPKIKIFVRSNYAQDKEELEKLNVHVICSEEETKKAFILALKEMC